MSEEDARRFQALSLIIALACVLHGKATGKWRTLHTVGTVLGVIGTIGPELQ